MPEVRIFDSLVNPRRRQQTQDPTARRATVNASDLTEIANRATQRQQAILEANPGSNSSLFPVQSTEGALPRLLSGVEPSTDSPITSVRRQSNAAGTAQTFSGGGTQQASAPVNVGPTPRLNDASFQDLTPTQRVGAYRTVFADEVDAVLSEDGSFAQSSSGSPIVAFRPRGSDQMVSVAQEVVPASALFAEAVRRLGIPASPVGSTERAVTYGGANEEVTALARKFGARLTQGADGISVEFDETHPINTRFHDNPFAEGQENQESRPDPRLRRLIQ